MHCVTNSSGISASGSVRRDADHGPLKTDFALAVSREAAGAF